MRYRVNFLVGMGSLRCTLTELCILLILTITEGASRSLLVTHAGPVRPTPTRVIISPSTTVKDSVSSTTALGFPVPSPASNFCSTGPPFVAADGRFINTNQVYIDLSHPITCSGKIVRWHYCNYVLGFPNIAAGVWPGVWRRTNDSSSDYELRGINNITLVPGEQGSTGRCGNYTPPPQEILTAEKGDFIGFYVPNDGLFLAYSTATDDPDGFLLELIQKGNYSVINESDLVFASTAGRPFLRAEIGESDSIGILSGPDPILPPRSSVGYLVTTTVVNLPVETNLPPDIVSAATIHPGLLAAVIVSAFAIVVLVVVIGVLVVYLVKVKKKQSMALEDSGVSDKSLQYNNMYIPSDVNTVVIDGHRRKLSVKTNPAYEGAHLVPGCLERDIDHTYESIASIASIAVNRVNTTERPQS